LWEVDHVLTILDDDLPDEEEWEAFRAYMLRLKAVVEKHFGIQNEESSWRLADFIWKRHSSSLQEFWNKNDITEDLAKLKRCVIDINRILERLPDGVSDNIRHSAIQSAKETIYRELAANSSLSAQDVLEDQPSWKAYRFLFDLSDHVSEITPLIDATTEYAATGSPVGNKALEAWRTVDVCAELCSLSPGIIKVPKSMNNSGPFYRFLSDVFEVQGHTEDPVSAFRGWRRHVGRKGE
jgi:hypothetical protein